MLLPERGVTGTLTSVYQPLMRSEIARPRGRRRLAGKVARYPNRIAELRIARGMTQQELADAVGMAWQTVGKYERGEARLKVDQARRFADALKVSREELDADGVPSLVPVVGYVGAGVEIFPFDDFPRGEGMRTVRCPQGLDPGKTAAVEVRGDSMFPIGDGWIIYFVKEVHGVPYEAVGQLCVVKLAHDGPTQLKVVRPGYSRGKFNLISWNAAPREDVEVEWASPVRGMLSPDLAS